MITKGFVVCNWIVNFQSILITYVIGFRLKSKKNVIRYAKAQNPSPNRPSKQIDVLIAIRIESLGNITWMNDDLADVDVDLAVVVVADVVVLECDAVEADFEDRFVRKIDLNFVFATVGCSQNMPTVNQGSGASK